jgi:CYTH domain-containing protein
LVITVAKEIERKFSVTDLSVLDGRLGTSIVQGYVVSEPMTVRVRIIGAEAIMTLKYKTSQVERDEYEFPMPMHQARELLSKHCHGRIVEKTRYRVPHAGHTYEIDVFAGKLSGLVIAEVELDYVDEMIDLPDWIGVELTYDRRFSNAALSMAEVPPSLRQVVPETPEFSCTA